MQDLVALFAATLLHISVMIYQAFETLLFSPCLGKREWEEKLYVKK